MAKFIHVLADSSERSYTGDEMIASSHGIVEIRSLDEDDSLHLVACVRLGEGDGIYEVK